MLTVPEEIKELLHRDSCNKNIRIHFPNGERSDICNNLIVRNSVSFTESLCSQDTLKFGLCESPVFECETVGVGNIKGATIEVFCEIFCDASISGAEFRPDLLAFIYPIPYGTFIVTSCDRQADMNHRRIQAYGGNNLLMSVDPSIKRKHTNLWLNQHPDYTPDIFKTAVVNARIKNRLSRGVYTELPLRSSREATNVCTYYIANIPGQTVIYMSLNLLYYRTNAYDWNKLFYIEKGAPLQNQYECANEAIQKMKELHNIYEPKFVEKVNETLRNKYERDLSVYNFGAIERSNGSYVYPYQYAEDDDPNPTIGPRVYVGFSVYYYHYNYNSGSYSYAEVANFADIDQIKIYDVDVSAYPQYTVSYPRELALIDDNNQYYAVKADINYHQLIQDMMELNGYFFNVSRDTINLLNIKQQFHLTPSGTLYPGSTIYPEGVTGGKLLPHDYQSCWYDDQYTKQFGAITCEYKNTSNEDCIFTLYISPFDADSDPESYQVYELNGNEIIDNSTWTDAQIQAICETIASNIAGVTYMPVEFVGRGLPYVEAGDTFEILTASNDSITTIVLNRTLSGEQVLTDSYKSV